MAQKGHSNIAMSPVAIAKHIDIITHTHQDKQKVQLKRSDIILLFACTCTHSITPSLLANKIIQQAINDIITTAKINFTII